MNASKRLQIRNHVVPVGSEPFEGDLYVRQQLADRLIKHVDMLRDGGAIAIDGAWGSGKSWFARNWMMHLESADRTSIYIDAFAMDYLEDPFLMIAGELIAKAKELDKGDKGTSLMEASGRVAKALLPITSKAIAGAAIKFVIGESTGDEIGEQLEAAIDGAGGFVEKQLEKRLETYEAEKQSIKSFKDRLTELTGKNANPIIVFIDELDRCKPDFAVKTLERIKHFFEVPGLVFVLMINRRQLVAAIQGAYGTMLDGDAYLRKFLLFSLSLPKGSPVHATHAQDYAIATLRAYDFPDNDNHVRFAQTFGILAARMNLELRDIERGVALYALAQPVNNLSELAAWAIAIKFFKPDSFGRLVAGDPIAHKEIVDAVKGQQGGVGESQMVSIALDLHHCYANRSSSSELKPATQTWIRDHAGALTVERIFPWIFSRIDLGII